jgi:hypothetical protein
MKGRKTHICGERHRGRICDKDPGHFGQHTGQGISWGEPNPRPRARRRRADPKQTRLRLGG